MFVLLIAETCLRRMTLIIMQTIGDPQVTCGNVIPGDAMDVCSLP
jgi:hypothetical protein